MITVKQELEEFLLKAKSQSMAVPKKFCLEAHYWRFKALDS
jgi:hypothetical protein